ncbi:MULTISPECIES: hypothetical protein [Ramlibacter]|uniref:hypothetical protein n=1 Tax=Ramlibacter TaxID=174951 RepID=UPI0015EEB2EB|nr:MULTISPECIES: hypothetical protein [Ramlibacter]MBA2960701.1 hypothetical protein [Ramlibacter sp. CGMCC 1.13660]
MTKLECQVPQGASRDHTQGTPVNRMMKCITSYEVDTYHRLRDAAVGRMRQG